MEEVAMSESKIEIGRFGVCYSGPDATELFRAKVIKNGLRLATRGIKPTRGWTLTNGLAMCERYTGKTYKRTQVEQAIRDLQVWIDTMTAALPIERTN
jgi:hypothetical protein